MDETAGRTAASVEEIPTRGTVYFVPSLVRQDVITADEARDVIDAMVEEKMVLLDGHVREDLRQTRLPGRLTTSASTAVAIDDCRPPEDGANGVAQCRSFGE
ncbi:hypothetical protein ACFQMA_01600 [Halosimplex aquaticum]|uniref:Uncharacterized protein n=1 Tax=Halosimplex aquaticum TaxID=3026162 RepID=A0ABD5XZA6_9EURY|nr:hypothetical protein [Halosimplex aquaticum]